MLPAGWLSFYDAPIIPVFFVFFWSLCIVAKSSVGWWRCGPFFPERRHKQSSVFQHFAGRAKRRSIYMRAYTVHDMTHAFGFRAERIEQTTIALWRPLQLIFVSCPYYRSFPSVFVPASKMALMSEMFIIVSMRADQMRPLPALPLFGATSCDGRPNRRLQACNWLRQWGR